MPLSSALNLHHTRARSVVKADCGMRLASKLHIIAYCHVGLNHNRERAASHDIDHATVAHPNLFVRWWDIAHCVSQSLYVVRCIAICNPFPCRVLVRVLFRSNTRPPQYTREEAYNTIDLVLTLSTYYEENVSSSFSRNVSGL